MRRQARLFAIAEYLRGRRSGVTAEAIAERFGVTVRTVYRDLDALREGQLPLQADRGRGGGYALDRTYTLPPVNFTAREAALLVTLGRWAHQLRLMPFARTLQQATDKVRSALSISAQRELIDLMDGLQFTGVPVLATPEPVRKAIEQAWFERLPLRIEYEKADGTRSKRLIELRSIVMERSLTMLNCIDLEKQEERQFRLDRVTSAAVLKQTAV